MNTIWLQRQCVEYRGSCSRRYSHGLDLQKVTFKILIKYASITFKHIEEKTQMCWKMQPSFIRDYIWSSTCNIAFYFVRRYSRHSVWGFRQIYKYETPTSCLNVRFRFDGSDLPYWVTGTVLLNFMWIWNTCM